MAEPHESASPVKRALLELREMRARLEAADAERHEPIAVIGVGCRFPGAVTDDESFWSLLWRGRDAIGEIPWERWNVDEHFDPDPSAPGKMATRRGGFLDAIDQFDPGFFGVSPREADSMDPQQRLVLEVAWEALEHAGLSPDALRGEPVGIFVGAGACDYLQLLLRRPDPASIDAYMASGGVLSVIAGRLAYFLGTQGPAMVIDTACSSSLVAVHQACQSLRRRESRVGIAAGVGVLLLPELTINFSQARMLSADGRCKTFDASADGYVRGEGCGVVILKRLSDAVRDEDRILAVVRGTAVNQDGRSSGLTAPNGVAQEAVIRGAVADGRVSPLEIDYVEAHGTGTSLGDPIEVLALARALGQSRTSSEPLLLGSVKTNLGHLEAAAGIAGFIKVVLALERAALPPTLHFERPNPHVPWDDLPVQVVTTPTRWPDRGRPRRAGVSSFGFSGTNAHVVLESAPERRQALETRPPASLLALSARTATALRAQAARYAAHFRDHPDLDPHDVCFTAAIGRRHFPARLAVVGTTLDELRAGLETHLEGGIDAEDRPEPRIVFAFPGQGSAFSAFARSLYASSAPFRSAVERCSHALGDRLAPPLEAVFVGTASDALLDNAAYLQPALFAFEYALAVLWQSWGIRPAAVVGHSLGEYVAACVAGAIELEDAIRLVAERGRLTASLPPGGVMAAVFADETTVREAASAYPGLVTIAGLNGPSNIVISGNGQYIRAVCDALAARGHESRTLQTAHAFHSPEIAPILDALEVAASDLRYTPARLPFASTLLGRRFESGERLSAAHWRRHTRDVVRFSDAVQSLIAEGFTHFLEVGPRATLCGLGRRMAPSRATVWLPSVTEPGSEWLQLLTTLGRLYTAGAAAEWPGVFVSKRPVVSLPRYPFERHRHWIEGAAGTVPTPPRRTADALWARIADATSRQAESAPFDLAPSSFAEKWAALHARSIATVEATLARLGAFTTRGATLSVDTLVERYGVQRSFRPLLERWLMHLVGSGHLERQHASFVARVAFTHTVPASVVERTDAAFRDYPEILRYFESCVARVDAVLTGRASPLETLFPDGDESIAEGLYARSAVARYMNAIVASAVGAAAAWSSADRKVRILEIGAGTGSTTRAVLPALDPERTEYVFTDVGPLFLMKAAERFAASPFVTFEAFDVEDMQALEKLGVGSFDVIIAANVLHATRDLAITLGNVRLLLRPSGTLVAIETTDHPIWLDLTTGLIAGWQRFDDHWRDGHPLLTVDAWTRALDHAGFAPVDAWPAAASPAAIVGQHVIIAQTADRLMPEAERPATRHEFKTASFAQTLPERNEVLVGVRGGVPGDRRRLLLRVVRDEVMRVLGLPADQPPAAHQRLMELGIDSLMAVELRTRLTEALALDRRLTATLIFDYPSIGAIADYLESLLDPSSVPRPDRLATDVHGRTEAIAALDDSAIADLVDARLRDLQV